MTLPPQDQLPDWTRYGYCPICGATRGVCCVALNGHVAGGRPAGPLTPLEVPHAARRLLKRLP